MGSQASYITHDQQARDEMDWTPEFSRRARGFGTYAVIQELGRHGIAQLIYRTCRHAKSIVIQASEIENIEVIAMPVINQGLIRFIDPNAAHEEDHDTYTEKVIRLINETGEAFFQPTTFKGKRCMRISVSGWRTNDEDVRRTVDAIRKSLIKATSND